jgi:soluble lytic murein transglycosylase-like protein
MSSKGWVAMAVINLTLMAAIVVILLVTSTSERDQVIVQQLDTAPDRPRGDIYVPKQYRAMLLYWCEQEEVPYDLMARIALVESNWNPNATNGKDHGLFQLNGKYLEYYGWKFNDGNPVDPYNVEIATKVACRYMRFLYGLCGDYRIVCAAYNAGFTRVTAQGLPEITSRYLDLVFGYEVDVF